MEEARRREMCRPLGEHQNWYKIGAHDAQGVSWASARCCSSNSRARWTLFDGCSILSIWSVCEMPRQLVKYISAYIVEWCFQKRLAFQSVDTDVSLTGKGDAAGHRSIQWGLKYHKKAKEEWLFSLPSWNPEFLLAVIISTPGSWAFAVGSGHTPLAPRFGGFHVGLLHHDSSDVCLFRCRLEISKLSWVPQFADSRLRPS